MHARGKAERQSPKGSKKKKFIFCILNAYKLQILHKGTRISWKPILVTYKNTEKKSREE
jgi:hypothetical protein